MKIQILSVLATSVVFKLDGTDRYHTAEYEIIINGEVWAISDRMTETVYDLTPSSEYKLTVRRGEEESDPIIVKTNKEVACLDVKDFGAKGDGETDDTNAIQAAIMCCPEGGRVLIEDGTFKFRNLFLKSNMVFEIGTNAVLSAFTDKSRIPVLKGKVTADNEKGEYIIGAWEGNARDSFASLISGMYIHDVVICGRGTIDGCANFDNWWNVEKRKNDPARPRMFFFNHCNNIIMEGITVTNSPSWNIHPYYSDNLSFYNLQILSPAKSHNTDGMDPESTKNVNIIGIRFSVGDDCIAIKSGKIEMALADKKPSEDILIEHCLMEDGHGAVTIGSESSCGVKNVTVTNCEFVNTDRGIRIKTRRGRGKDSIVEDIICHHIGMEHVKVPFVVNSFYYCGADGKTDYVADTNFLPVDERTPEIKNIALEDIECRNADAAACYVYGLPEKKIEKLVLRNISVTYEENAKEGKPAMMRDCMPCRKMGVFIRNVKQLFLDNIRILGAEGNIYDIDGVDVVKKS